MQINCVTIRLTFLAATGEAVLAAMPATVQAVESVDPDLIPEAREVLDYLASVYGEKPSSARTSSGRPSGSTRPRTSTRLSSVPT